MGSKDSYCISHFVLLFLFLFLEEHVAGSEVQHGLTKFSIHKERLNSHPKDLQEMELNEGRLKFEEVPPKAAEATNEAIAAYRPQNFGSYFGIVATLTVPGLTNLQAGQESAAFVSVKNVGILDRPLKELDDFITAGWMVNPEKYNDNETHFFIHWQADVVNCYDLDCPEFELWNNSKLAPGGVLNQDQNITIKIYKNQTSDEWWLHYGNGHNLKPMGYFPISVFINLHQNANTVQFGGTVSFKGTQKSPPMGTGRLPEDGEAAAASIKDIRYIDQEGKFTVFNENLSQKIDYGTCYGLGSFTYDKFLFGGPGGCSA